MEKFAIYEQMLKNELIVATGCTEPIALSLAGAKLVETLKGIPTHIDAYICGNIIKNAKSVTVPNTNGLKGLKAAIAAGVAVGDSKNDLEILSSLKEKDLYIINDFLEKDKIHIHLATNCKSLYINLKGYLKTDFVEIIIEDLHNNITFIKMEDVKRYDD